MLLAAVIGALAAAIGCGSSASSRAQSAAGPPLPEQLQHQWSRALAADAHITAVATSEALPVGAVFVAGAIAPSPRRDAPEGLFLGSPPAAPQPAPGRPPAPAVGADANPEAARASTSDAFIAQLTPDGGVSWLTRVGGPGRDRVTALAADADQVIAGLAITPPLAIADVAITGSGRPDAAVLGLTPSGEIRWSQPLSSSRYVRVQALALAADGTTTAVGMFAGTLRIGDQVMASAGATDLFVARFSLSGQLLGALRFGGVGSDLAYDVVSDSAQLIVAGHFGAEVDLGLPALQAPGGVIFALAAADRDGDDSAARAADPMAYSVAWLRPLGAQTVAARLARAPDGRLCVGGHFAGQLTLAERTLSSQAGSDGFAACLDPNGDPIWVTRLASGVDDSVRGLRWSSRGLVIAGSFGGTLTSNGYTLNSTGERDLFIALMRPSDGVLSAARRVGGPGYDELAALGVGVEDRVFIAGGFATALTLDDANVLTADRAQAGFAAAFGW
ncbi:MAG: hypothetical protein Tsb0020_35540 [Haliangiales bacterium]